jgi:hypothetical protein
MQRVALREALLRRTGIVPNTGARYGPGSAMHRSARATRSIASGARKPVQSHSRTCECIPIPVSRTSLILIASCSRGALHEAFGSGAGCGACGCVSQTQTREAGGNCPGPLRDSALNGWTGRVKGGETCLDGELRLAPAPGSTVPRTETPRRSVERRCRGLYFPAIRETSRGLYQGASFGAPSPLIFEGRELKA